MLKGGKIAIKNLNILLNESYKNKDKTEKNINNFVLDEDLSTDKTKVYRDLDSDDIKIVNRGTFDKRDVLTDAKLILGIKDKKRFNEAREILEKVKNKYPDKSIDVIGHSLGAKVAEDLGKNDPRIKNIITLNKPTTPYDLIRKDKSTDKQYDIRTTKDLVSMLQPIQRDENDIIIPSETNNFYKEHKIDVLDRLEQDRIIGEGLRTKNLKTLSNHDLYNLADKIKIKINDIIMRDEANDINKDGFYIINLDNSNGKGTHWTALYFHPLTSFYFDSFGFVPPEEIEGVIRPFEYNDNDIQDYNSSACGWYCLAFIKFLHNKQNKKESYKQFIRMFKGKTIENDDILYRYLFN